MSDEKTRPATIGRIPLQIDDAVARGAYSNTVLISHSETEVVIDFAFVHAAPPRARVESRIILAPRQAKRLLHTLGDNLRKYEERFGEIPSPTSEDPLLH